MTTVPGGPPVAPLYHGLPGPGLRAGQSSVRDRPQSNIVQTDQIVGGEPKPFYIIDTKNGIFAECEVYNKDRIVVLAGSTATKRRFSEGHYETYRRLKERLIENGVLVDNGQLYAFAKSYEFQSPTPATGIVLGNTGMTRPRERLHDANGIPFAEYYPK